MRTSKAAEADIRHRLATVQHILAVGSTRFSPQNADSLSLAPVPCKQQGQSVFHPDGTVEVYGDDNKVQRIEAGDAKGRILIVREWNDELEQQLRESNAEKDFGTGG